MTRKEYESDLAKRNSQKNETGKTAREQYDFELKSRKAQEVGNGLIDKANNLLQSSSSLYSDYNNRYKSGNETYRPDSSEYYNKVKDSARQYFVEYDDITKTLDDYSEVFDEKWVNDFKSSLSNDRSNVLQVLDYAGKDNKYWGQFKDENDYNEQKKAYDEYEKIMNYDTAAAQTEIEELTKKYNDLSSGPATVGSVYEQQKIYDDITAKQNYLNKATSYQNGKKLEDDAMSASDFNAYANKEVTASSWGYERYFLDDLFKAKDFGTDTQKKVYNYYLQKEHDGLVAEGTADKYYDYIKDALTAREGESLANTWNAPVMRDVFAVYAGIDSFFTNIGKYFNGDVSPTATEYASQAITEDLGGVERTAYNVFQSVGNMLPTIAISFLSQGIASGLGASATTASAIGEVLQTGGMSLSGAGADYANRIRNGESESRARTLATINGIWEGVSEHYLGSIENVGKNVIGEWAKKGILQPALNKIANGAVKAVVDFGIDVFNEGAEEVIQDIGSSLIEGVLTGKYEFSNLEELSESFVIGSLSAFVLNGATGIANKSSDIFRARKIKNNEQMLKSLTEAGKTFDADTLAYKIANKITDKSSVWKISELLQEERAYLSEQTKSDIKNALAEKGVNADDAEAISEWLAASVLDNRSYFTERQQKALDNPLIQQVYRDVVINSNSTVNQRISGITGTSSGDNLDAISKITDKQNLNGKLYTQQKGRTEVEKIIGGKSLSIEENVSKVEGVSPTKIISKSKNGEMTLELENGEVVKSSDIKYKSGDEAFLYNYVAKNNYDTETSNAIVNGFKASNGIDINTYIVGVDEGIKYGYTGTPMSAINSDKYFNDLTDTQKKFAYNLGKEMAKKDDAKAEKHIQSTPKTQNKRTGKVELNVPYETLTDIQKVSYDTVTKVVADITNSDVEFYQSKSQNGKRVFAENIAGHKIGESAPNGFYDSTTGKIYLDLNAGNSGEGVILYTFAHEVTHFIRQWSPAKFRTLGDFLAKEYGKSGQDMIDLAKRHQLLAKQKGRNMSFAEAYEEVVADSMQTMFTDVNLVEKLEKLKSQDKTLWEKIKEAITELFNRIKEAYAKLDPYSIEARAIREMGNLKKLSDIFAEGIFEAGENFSSAESVNVSIDVESESASPYEFSLRTWNESEYSQDFDNAANELSKAIGISVSKAKMYISDVNSIAKMIAEDKGRLDYTETGLSPFVSNAEYGGSFDYTTLCKKRRLLTGTFSAIQKALPNTALTAQEILEIRSMMDKAGLEVSCGKCYVEGSRANMGIFTQKFIDLYRKYYPNSWYPNLAEMNTPDGIEKIRIEHPEVYEQYEYFWNHYGTLKEGDPNLFASQQKPKLYQMRSAYNGEILKFFKNDNTVSEKNVNGGIRMQSFSDFEIVHLIDAMQTIMDMSRVGLNGQAYTKVPDFAWALGDTGLKINLSIDAWSVDENGKLVFNNKEGMPFETAMDLRRAYSKNVGTICCVYDDAQLLAALADDRIDFVIPFHRSQWKKSQYKAMGLPTTTKDYTYQQNEKWLNPGEHTHEYKGRQVPTKCTNFMPNEYWDFTKSGVENAKIYLDLCAKSGKRPKFYKLLDNNGDGTFSLKKDGSTDGYWKLLIDFKMYDNDGNGSPQMPVKPTFNMSECYRMLNEYKGGHENFPVAQGIVDEFVSKYKEAHKGQKFSDRDSEYLELAKDSEKNKTRLQEMVKQVAKANGYTIEAYQGTRNFGYKTSMDGVVWFTDRLDVAESYSGVDKISTIADGGKSIDIDAMPIEDVVTMLNVNTNGAYGNNAVKKYGEQTLRHAAKGISQNPGNYHVFINSNNMLSIDCNGSNSRNIPIPAELSNFFYKSKASTDDIASVAFEQGYNVVEFSNIYDYWIFKNVSGTQTTYAVNNASSVKSADPVTYDDNGNIIPLSERFDSGNDDIRYSDRITDESLLDFLNEQYSRGEYDPVKNPNGGYYITYKSMSFWGYDEQGRPILRSPMAEYVDGKLSNAYIIPNKGEPINWYVSTETIDKKTGIPKGLKVQVKETVTNKNGKSETKTKYLSAIKNPELIADDWSNLYFGLKKKVSGKDSNVDARYNPYEHSSDKMLNDQFSSAYKRPNLVTVKMIVPVSEDGGAFRAKYSKDATGWTEWKSGIVAGKISSEKKDFSRNVYLSRYAAPIEIVPNSEVAKAYKEYLDGTDVYVPWNVVSPDLREELVKAGVNVSYEDATFGKAIVKFSDYFDSKYSDRNTLPEENVAYEISESYGVKNSKEFKALINTAYKAAKAYDSGTINDYDSVDKAVNNVVKHITNKLENGKKTLAPEAKEILNQLKNIRFRLSDGQKQEVKNVYGSVKSYNQSLFGMSVKSDDNSRTELSTIWGELSDAYPNYFKRDANPNDMPIIFKDVVDTLKTSYDTSNLQLEEITQFAEDVYFDVLDVVNSYVHFEALTPKDTRTMLADALENTARTQLEKDKLAQYKSEIENISKMQEELIETRAKIKELSFAVGKRDTVTLNALKEKAVKLANNINTYDKKLLRLEATAPLQEIIKREKAAVQQKANAVQAEKLADYRQRAIEEINKQKQKGKEKLDDYKDKQNVTYYKTRIAKITFDLSKRLLRPTSKTAIPDAFAQSVSKFLATIDFTTTDKSGALKDTKRNANLILLQTALNNLSKELESNAFGVDSENNIVGTLDISPDMVQWVKDMSNWLSKSFRVDGTFKIQDMSSEQLATLYKLLKGLNRAVNNATKFYRDNARDVSDDAVSTMDYAATLDRSNNKLLQGMGKILKWDFATPVSAFDRFGEGGKNRLKELVLAQGAMAQNVRYLQNFVDEAYTEREVETWQNDNVSILIGGTEYQTTIAQLMSLYVLLNQKDSRRHILEGGGIRFADVTIKGNTKLTDKVIRYENIFFDEKDVAQVVQVLNEKGGRAIEVAEAMQKFLAETGAKWGNAISQVRFGYNAFGIEDYVPIRTVASGAEYQAVMQKNNIFALLNKSFTKERSPKANNAVIVDSIFEVFAQHMSDMALYNAWALPVLDCIKWFNYKEAQDIANKHPERSLKESLRLAYGDPAVSYVSRFLSDINSSSDSGLSESIAFASLRMFNRVAVAANIRVAVQQPFSITRAFELINPKYCVPLVGKARREAYNEMLDNSSFGLWKSMGYFDVDIARPFATQVLKNQAFGDKVIEKSMFMAEDGDNFTWAVLWNACKAEARKNNPNVADDELMAKTKIRFDDLILRTQVVDSVLTRSQWMRSDKFFHRMTSSFMSEPIVSYNALLRRYDTFMRDRAVYGNNKALSLNAKPFGKALGIFLLTQIVNALVTAPIDAARDDDDYETYFEKLVEKFKSNALDNILIPNLPIINDVVEYVKYGKSSRNDLQIWTRAFDFAKSVYNTIENYDFYKLHKLFKSTLEAVSVASGLPISNALRDVIAMWNTMMDAFGNPSLKFQTSKEPNKNGYTKIYDAIKNGDEDKAVSMVVRMNGNSVDTQNIVSNIKTLIKNDYLTNKVDAKTAQEFLLRAGAYLHDNISESDIHWTLNRWDYEIENGSTDGYSKYDDLEGAVRTGKNLKSIIREYIDNGVSKETLAAEITKIFKAEYVSASKAERAKMKGYLLNAYSALGYDRTEKSKAIDRWVV